MSAIRKLFVAMPFGLKRGFLDPEQTQVGEPISIDFDSVWKGMLAPAIERARVEGLGLRFERADQLQTPGLIDKIYTEWLLEADVVLADLTFGNPNVYYELGIRHALASRGSVLVAHRGTRLPFDVRNLSVLEYDPRDAPSLLTFQSNLQARIEAAALSNETSPLRVFLPGLHVARYQDGQTPDKEIASLREKVAALEADLAQQRAIASSDRLMRKIQDALGNRSRLLSLGHSPQIASTTSAEVLETLGRQLHKVGAFDEALAALQRALALEPENPDILRELGFVYRKKGPAFYGEAERYMKAALAINDHDVELLGMYGGLLKRRGELSQAYELYSQAQRLEPNDPYAVVTLAGICVARNLLDDALRWYRKLLDICTGRIEHGSADYWTYLCLGQARVALGDEQRAIEAYKEVTGASRLPPVEDLRSEEEQLRFIAKHGLNPPLAERAADLLRDARDHAH